jgi:chromosome partitioning protein
MKTLALFSSKGGVGRTSIAYHLGFMFAELGRRVVLADFDPQANLSAMCLSEDRLDAIWTRSPPMTIAGAVDRLRRGVADIDPLEPEAVTDKIALVPGDLQLSELEDELSQQWARCLDSDARAFRITAALHRTVTDAGVRSGADIAIIDVAPNFGAISRAALLAADHVIVPVAPDPLALKGLESAGRQVVAWRDQWWVRRRCAPSLDFELPRGNMNPLGYVVARQPAHVGQPLTTLEHWMERIPVTYRQSFGLRAEPDLEFLSDEFCLAELQDYPSLMHMAHEAKRPLFLLKPADGALGGFQSAVRAAYQDYRALAVAILERLERIDT